jgi:hypothetical protein
LHEIEEFICTFAQMCTCLRKNRRNWERFLAVKAVKGMRERGAFHCLTLLWGSKNIRRVEGIAQCPVCVRPWVQPPAPQKKNLILPNAHKDIHKRALAHT